LKHAAKKLAGAKEVILADKLLPGPRPHAGGQRLRLLQVSFMNVVKQVDGGDSSSFATESGTCILSGPIINKQTWDAREIDTVSSEQC
jgi:hypothetical protein